MLHSKDTPPYNPFLTGTLLTKSYVVDFEKEPTMVYTSRDNDIIFEWLSDPEKVDYCKYFVQLILYLDGSANLKVMYYNEVVRDKKSMDIDYTVGKLNRYVHDFESLMR